MIGLPWGSDMGPSSVETEAIMPNPGQGNDGFRKEWNTLFHKLDQKDGIKDGRINIQVLEKWVKSMTLADGLSIEANLNVGRGELINLIHDADGNRDGFVDHAEFFVFISNRNDDLTQKQLSDFHQIFRALGYGAEVRYWPPPLFIMLLSLAQLIIYTCHVCTFWKQGQSITSDGPTPFCSVLIFDPNNRSQFWRYLTYSLVHSGYVHIIINLIMQFMLGLPLEMTNGTRRIAIVYMSGVLVGSLGASIWDPRLFLSGASSGVYALISAHSADLVLNWSDDIWIIKHRIDQNKSNAAKRGHIVRAIRLGTVAIFVGMDIGTSVYRHNSNFEGGGISYSAHLSGAIAGLFIGLVVLKNRKVEFWEKTAKTWSVRIYLVLIVGAILWHLLGDFIFCVTRDQDYFGNKDFLSCEKCRHFLSN